MKIKLFFFAGLVFLILLGAFVFHVNSAEYTLEIGSYSLTLPVVLWVLLPAAFIFVVALAHMSFYGLLRYLKYKHFFDDGAKFEDFANALLLEKPVRVSFKTNEFRNASELMRCIKEGKKLAGFDKFSEIMGILSDLNEGKSVKLKKFKLDESNPLVLKNEQNLIKSDLEYAFSLIKNKKEFENESDEIAFEELLQKGTKEQIFALKLPKTPAQVLGLIRRFEKDSLELNGVEFESLISGVNFSENEFLQIAKMSIKKLNPDALIAIFKSLKNTHLEALRAYLFILADLSMYDELRLEISHDKKGFNDFKLVLLAREKNLKIDLDALVV